MTRLRLVEEDAMSLERGEIRRDVEPDDRLACLVILRDEIKRRGLGDWTRYRIDAWDPYAGWVEHRPERAHSQDPLTESGPPAPYARRRT